MVVTADYKDAPHAVDGYAEAEPEDERPARAAASCGARTAVERQAAEGGGATAAAGGGEGGRASGERCARRVDVDGSARDDDDDRTTGTRQPRATADVLYVAAGPRTRRRMVRALRAAGYRQPIMGGDSFDTPSAGRAAEKTGGKVYYTTHAASA